MKKTIIMLLFLNIFNLYALEEIELQWEDITPPAGFTPRYLQQDDNENFWGLLGSRIFFYEYATNTWTAQNLPTIIDINKVIDFDVDENQKAYFVIEDSNQFLIYDINTKEISYLDLPIVDGYKYYYTYKIINNKIFYSLIDENYNFELIHYDINTNLINQIDFNTSIIIHQFKYNRMNKSIIGKQEFIFNYPYDFDFNKINYSKLPVDHTGMNLSKIFIGQSSDNVMFVNNAKGNDSSTIILYQTKDNGNNWELLIDGQTTMFDIYNILYQINNDDFISIIGNYYKDFDDKVYNLGLFSIKENKLFLSRIPEFGNQDITDIAYSWGTKDTYIPIDQNIYLTKNNELIVYSKERMLKTDLKKITSIENEPTAPLKNLSVLYGNISDNRLNININIESGINSTAKISLYSSDMKAIEQFNEVDFMQGKNELTFKINSQLSTGVYYVFIESGNYKHFYKIIKN